MTTVVNTPGGGEHSDSSASILIVVVLILVLAGLFFVYGLPAIRDNNPEADSIDVNIKMPGTGNTAPTTP